MKVAIPTELGLKQLLKETAAQLCLNGSVLIDPTIDPGPDKAGPDVLWQPIFFLFNKHLLKKHLYRTKLTFHYSTYITRHRSTHYITVLIGLITSTYFLLILTVSY